MNVLLILTINWPYGKLETFMENESKYVSGFDKHYCMPFYTTINKRETDDNLNIVSFTKVNSFFALISFLFSKLFYKELFFLLINKKFSYVNFKILFSTGILVQQRYFMLFKWIKKNINSNDFLTLYCYWMASDASAVSKLKKRFQNIKFVTRCHRFDLYENESPDNYIPFRKSIFDNVDHIYAISDHAKKYLKVNYPYLDMNKVSIARLGTTDYGTSPAIELNKSIKIVSCSNVIEVKRINRMIESLMEIDENIEWIHFGDGELREKLTQLVKCLPKNVTFTFKGSISNKDLMKWYSENNVNLFVNTSVSEGIPVSIMEALSFGIPVIATDVGGTNEIVNPLNGYLLDKDFKNKDLIRCIKNYRLLSKNERVDKHHNARIFWNKHYNAKHNYEEFYNSLKNRKEDI